MTQLSDEELREVIREARAAEAVHPHRVASESDRQARPGFVACACGRVFEAQTWGRAVSNHRRHRDREAAASCDHAVTNESCEHYS